MGKLIKPNPLFLGGLTNQEQNRKLKELALKRSKVGKKNKPRSGDAEKN